MKYSDAEIYAIFQKIGSKRGTAHELKMPRSTVQDAIKRVEAQNDVVSEEKKSHLELELLKAKRTIDSLQKDLKRINGERLSNDDVRQFLIGLELDNVYADINEVLTYNKNTPIVPHLMLSDLHWGEVVKPEQVNYLNEYNLKVAKKRLTNTISRFIHVIKHKFNNGKNDQLYLHLNGDIVNGTIHDEFLATNDLPMGGIFMDCFQNLLWAINVLKDEFETVKIIATHGNHGRFQKQYQFKNSAYNNYDWLLASLIQKFYENDEDVSVLNSDSTKCDFEVLGTKYRQTHGNQFRGGQGFLGCIAPITRGEKKMYNAAVSYESPYEKLLIGHWHTSLWLPKVIANGSMIGYNEMASECEFEFDYPKQMGWFTDKELGAVTPIEIRCDDF